MYIDSCIVDQVKLQNSCNELCFKEMGPICRSDIEKNLEWSPTKADNSIKVPCLSNVNSNHPVKYMYRECVLDVNGKAFWKEPNLSECLNKSIEILKNEVFRSQL